MNRKIIIGVTVILLALVYLIVGGVRDSAVYYVTVSELYENGQPTDTRGYRVTGRVVPESIYWNPDSLTLLFTLQQGGDSLKVIYHDMMPDQLADAQQAVVEGHWDGNRSFTAQKILLKCPSKYEIKTTDHSPSVSG
jgi:cytochrome c-type biogenesis protein CcmE